MSAIHTVGGTTETAMLLRIAAQARLTAASAVHPADAAAAKSEARFALALARKARSSRR